MYISFIEPVSKIGCKIYLLNEIKESVIIKFKAYLSSTEKMVNKMAKTISAIKKFTKLKYGIATASMTIKNKNGKIFLN